MRILPENFLQFHREVPFPSVKEKIYFFIHDICVALPHKKIWRIHMAAAAQATGANPAITNQHADMERELNKGLPPGAKLSMTPVEWDQQGGGKFAHLARKTCLIFAKAVFPNPPANLTTSLSVLEEVLPSILYQVVGDHIDSTLKVACIRVKLLLEVLAEHLVEDKKVEASQEEKGKDPSQDKFVQLLQQMHKYTHFPAIKNFAGNVGDDYKANQEVILEGNPRERTFFLINTWRNLLYPMFSAMGEDELGKVLGILKDKLGWEVSSDFLLKNPYFDYSTVTKMRQVVKDRVFPENPSVAKLKGVNHYCTQPLSEREFAYATTRAGGDIGKPIYWGSADAKFDPARSAENPASVAMSEVPQVCSLSGVVSDTMDLCTQVLGLSDPSFIQSMKLVFLAVNPALFDKMGRSGKGMVRKNHSAAETLYPFAFRENRPFIVSPLWYMDVLQGAGMAKSGPVILAQLQEAMKERGYASLPHQILIKA